MIPPGKTPLGGIPGGGIPGGGFPGGGIPVGDPAIVPPVRDDDLHAYVDGQASPARRAAIEAHLAVHPDVAADVAADQEIVALLRAGLAGKAAEPIPNRLRVARILAARRRRTWHRMGAVAAAVAWLAIGAGAGWFGHGAVRGPLAGTGAAAATGDAIAAYRTFVVEKLHPVEVPATQEAHLVQWLSRRLGRPLAAPDLTAQGYDLMGGRLLPAGRDPAAMFMYAGRDGTRLALYVHAGGSPGDAGFRFAQSDGVSAFAWVEQDLSYVVTATTDRPRLLDVAEAVYHQLSPPTGRPPDTPPGRSPG